MKELDGFPEDAPSPRPSRRARGKAGRTAKPDCHLSKSEFLAVAVPIRMVFAKPEKEPDAVLIAGVKRFTTGGVGWHVAEKFILTLPDGSAVRVQVNCNISVIGSKEAPEKSVRQLLREQVGADYKPTQDGEEG